jgi:carbamoyl-phosphate synthase small subunit
MPKGMLLLEDGTFWEGEVFGSTDETFGEIVFNTAFTGYEEILTDPSYAGQIVVMTTPHVGNYGISLEDMESSRCHVRGFVVKEAEFFFSSWRAQKSLGAFLKEQSVFGLFGVDTRSLVKHLREKGAMRAVLSIRSKNPKVLLEKVKASPLMTGATFLNEVSISKIRHYSNLGPRILLYDFGFKKSILSYLLNFEFEVFVLPGETSPEEALDLKPNGIILSNGPGDPAALPRIIQNIKILLRAEIPILGICLGHQLLALALGAKTYKLKFGHRGGNHPVKNLDTGTVWITAHNHGFAVDPDTLPSRVRMTFQNLYDQTLEGFCHSDFPYFAVQFHPESAPGPHDAKGIFFEFKERLPKWNI